MRRLLLFVVVACSCAAENRQVVPDVSSRMTNEPETEVWVLMVERQDRAIRVRLQNQSPSPRFIARPYDVQARFYSDGSEVGGFARSAVHGGCVEGLQHEATVMPGSSIEVPVLIDIPRGVHVTDARIELGFIELDKKGCSRTTAAVEAHIGE